MSRRTIGLYPLRLAVAFHVLLLSCLPAQSPGRIPQWLPRSSGQQRKLGSVAGKEPYDPHVKIEMNSGLSCDNQPSTMVASPHGRHTEGAERVLQRLALPGEFVSADIHRNAKRESIWKANAWGLGLHKDSRRTRLSASRMKTAQWMRSKESSLDPYRTMHKPWKDKFESFLGRESNGTTRFEMPKLPADSAEWVSNILQSSDVNSMRRDWCTASSALRRLSWPTLVFWCLDESAKKTLQFLVASYQLALPPFEMVVDCLVYLATAHSQEIVEDQGTLDLFRLLIYRERAPQRWPAQGLKKRHLGLLLSECTLEEGRQMLDNYSKHGILSSAHSMLRFMDFFTKAGDFEYALEALNMIAPERRSQSDADILQRCSNLLKLDFVERDAMLKNFAILPRILEAGVKPNLVNYNIILQNAFDHGMSGVGWDLFSFLKEQGFEGDSYTYLALMKDALSRDDIEGLEKIFSAIHQRKDLSSNGHLVIYITNVIRRLHMTDRYSTTSAAYARMLAMYSRAYNVAILVKLGMVKEGSMDSLTTKLHSPSPDKLGYMILSYVLVQHESYVVNALWARCLDLLVKGDDTVRGLVQHDVFYNAFLLYYARSSEDVPRCVDVIRFMVSAKHCKPTAKSWGILMLAFMKHGQPESAEKVRNMMLDKGFVPDEQTMEIMKRKYPYTDLGSRAGKVLKGIEEQPLTSADRQSVRKTIKPDQYPEDCLSARAQTARSTTNETLLEDANLMTQQHFRDANSQSPADLAETPAEKDFPSVAEFNAG